VKITIRKRHVQDAAMQWMPGRVTETCPISQACLDAGHKYASTGLFTTRVGLSHGKGTVYELSEAALAVRKGFDEAVRFNALGAFIDAFVDVETELKVDEFHTKMWGS
jgi:hypothetical protein